jgi:uncharacterized protein HemX
VLKVQVCTTTRKTPRRSGGVLVATVGRVRWFAALLVAALLGGAVFVGITMEQRMEALEAEVEAREAEVATLMETLTVLLPTLTTKIENHVNAIKSLQRGVSDLEADVSDRAWWNHSHPLPNLLGESIG